MGFKDGIFHFWEYGGEALESSLHLLKFLDPKLKFTQKLELERRFPFLDVLVHRKDKCLEFGVYRKLTHSDSYLNYPSNHSPAMKEELSPLYLTGQCEFVLQVSWIQNMTTLEIFCLGMFIQLVN